MTRLLLGTLTAAALASSTGCRLGCGERHKWFAKESCSPPPGGRLASVVRPDGCAACEAGMSGPVVGLPVSGPGGGYVPSVGPGYTGPGPGVSPLPNELPPPSEVTPGPLAPNRPADGLGAANPAPQPLTPPVTTPVGLPK